MAALEEQIKSVEADIQDLKMKLSAKEGELRGLQIAQSAISGKAISNSGRSTEKQRTPIKGIALQILEDCGPLGADASKIVTIAEREHSVSLKRASVSSLLSRLTSDGVLDYDQVTYRLKKYAENKPDNTDGIVHFRTSGAMQ